MANITQQDARSLAKTLRIMADAIDSDPDLAFKLSGGRSRETKKTGADNATLARRVSDTDLYAHARGMSRDKLMAYLRGFSADELKGFLKKYNLGYTRLKSADSIAAHLADQLKKRTADVFLRHGE